MEEKSVKALAISDARVAYCGEGLVSKLISHLFKYPFVTARCYVGPGNWDISNLDMSHPETKAFVEQHPEYLKQLELASGEARVDVSLYWGPLCARLLRYDMKKEAEHWTISSRRVIGMS